MPAIKEKETAARPFVIRGAADERIEVPAGEYYFNTKARARRMMLNSLSADARRVYACLELATMGYQQELAVTLERGRQRPLTPADVSDQTGLSRQHVRAGLRELETAGLAERRAQDGGHLRKGQVLLYCWATPRRPGEKNCSRAQLQFPQWFPEEWEPLKQLITRRKLLISLDEESARRYISEGVEVARRYKEAEIVAARFLESVCAPTPHIRRKEIERKNPPPPPESPPKPTQDDEEDFPNQPRENTNTPPLVALDVIKPRGFGVQRIDLTVKTPPPLPAGAPAVPAVPAAAWVRGEPPTADNSFDRLARDYPRDRFDHAAAAAQWRRKAPAQRQRALDALPKFLTCPRWAETPEYIPTASEWLRKNLYEYEPPRLLRIKAKRQEWGPSLEEAQRNIADDEASRKKTEPDRNGGES